MFMSGCMVNQYKCYKSIQVIIPVILYKMIVNHVKVVTSLVTATASFLKSKVRWGFMFYFFSTATLGACWSS